MAIDESILRDELETLRNRFERLYLADVFVSAETEKRLTFSRRPVRRQSIRLERCLRRGDETHIQSGSGIRVYEISPRTIEEFAKAELWYDVEGKPVVNSVGQSLILVSGYATWHYIRIGGQHASQVDEVLKDADKWACSRWHWLGPLLLPNRNSACEGSGWLDVVSLASEKPINALLKQAEWCVIIGSTGQRWPVSMWKTRDEWQLGEPRYTAEDVQRIGEEPEIVYAKRD